MSPESCPIVLLVDDDHRRATSVAKLLTSSGLQVLRAASLVEAVQQLSHHPEVLLLNAELPGLKHDSFWRAFRGSLQDDNIPVVQFSPSATHSAGESDEIFFKGPLDPSALLATTQALLRARHSEQQLARVKDELAAQLADLTRLIELTRRLSGALDLKTLLREILATVASIQGTGMGVLMFYDPDQKNLYPVASVGFPDHFFEDLGRLPVGLGASGKAVQDRRPVVLEDVEREPAFRIYLEAAHQAGYRSIYSVPMIDREGRALGAITTHFREPHRPTPRDVRLVELFAHEATVFIESARLYEERRRAEEALRLNEKLAATGRLAASLAHEINNPLAAVTNLLYLLGQNTSLTPEASQLVALATSEISRVGHITKNMLGLYRESPTPVALKLGELLDNILDLYGPRIRATRIVIEKRYESDEAVPGYPAELRQLFSNLLLNALEAMGDEGRLCLHVASGREWNGQQRRGVRVVVADNGSGIDAAHRRKIFDPFFTTKGERGTGLGLWVSHGIVRKHQGSIRVHSSTRPGKSGTCFSVFLPDGSAPAEVKPRRAKAAQPA